MRTSGDNIRIVNAWKAENLTQVYIPQLATLPRAGGGRLLFHRIAAGQLARLFVAIEHAGLMGHILTWDGGWVPRTIRSAPGVLSNHAYGTAFDLNARWNPFYGRAAPVGSRGSLIELVRLANEHGFWWGGHWNYNGRGACDAMHFEWAVAR